MESYRVKFRLGGSIYYTEWFETIDEALNFAFDAAGNSGITLLGNIEHEIL